MDQIRPCVNKWFFQKKHIAALGQTPQLLQRKYLLFLSALLFLLMDLSRMFLEVPVFQGNSSTNVPIVYKSTNENK